jgi:hypothetical protein
MERTMRVLRLKRKGRTGRIVSNLCRNSEWGDSGATLMWSHKDYSSLLVEDMQVVCSVSECETNWHCMSLVGGIRLKKLQDDMGIRLIWNGRMRWQIWWDMATLDCLEMLDEVDILHVKKYTLSEDKLLSYIGYMEQKHCSDSDNASCWERSTFL